MQGITLYIILGILIAAVITFLIVTSIFDRKKRKKLKIEKDIEDKEKSNAKKEFVAILIFILKKNQELLNDFQPSIGKLKMSDIKNKARDTITILERSKIYNFVKMLEDKEIIDIFVKLKTNNSNIWKKKLTNEIEILNNIAKKDKVDVKNGLVKEIINKIKGAYNESTK